MLRNLQIKFEFKRHCEYKQVFWTAYSSRVCCARGTWSSQTPRGLGSCLTHVLALTLHEELSSYSVSTDPVVLCLLSWRQLAKKSLQKSFFTTTVYSASFCTPQKQTYTL
jgi:hypothetical protein